MADVDLTSYTVRELLTLYRQILAELTRRRFVRTRNAPIGDLAEYTASIMYTGVLENNSAKAFDLIAADGRRIQVKVRTKDSTTKPGQVFSPIRSSPAEYDACLFVIVDSDTGDVVVAREWTSDEVQQHAKHRERTNAWVVRVSQIRHAGIDVTDQVTQAWVTLMAAVERAG
ncbi:DUF6998 domain-containing protein [Agromyces humi]|uniref:DUF6998 domain-containing protein n=1 Tax=Agromyces humi TaxID=1766800 RepID=UPI001356F132|nr:hypothetical protein [Agromyces humi]